MQDFISCEHPGPQLGPRFSWASNPAVANRGRRVEVACVTFSKLAGLVIWAWVARSPRVRLACQRVRQDDPISPLTTTVAISCSISARIAVIVKAACKPFDQLDRRNYPAQQQPPKASNIIRPLSNPAPTTRSPTTSNPHSLPVGIEAPSSSAESRFRKQFSRGPAPMHLVHVRYPSQPGFRCPGSEQRAWRGSVPPSNLRPNLGGLQWRSSASVNRFAGLRIRAC